MRFVSPVQSAEKKFLPLRYRYNHCHLSATAKNKLQQRHHSVQGLTACLVRHIADPVAVFACAQTHRKRISQVDTINCYNRENTTEAPHQQVHTTHQ